MGPALHISGASGGACPSVTTGSGAPDADLAARGEVTLVINGTAVAVPRDRGGNLAGAGVGVGAALPFTFGALSGAALLATGTQAPPPAASFASPHRTPCSTWNWIQALQGLWLRGSLATRSFCVSQEVGFACWLSRPLSRPCLCASCP